MTTQNYTPSHSQEFLQPPVHPALHRRQVSARGVSTPPLPPRRSPSPSPITEALRSGTNAADTLRDSDPSSIPGSIADEEDLNSAEQDLTEARLRELYEEEEIDRFIRLFSTYVSEVRSPAPKPSPGASTSDLHRLDASEDQRDALLDQVQSGEDDSSAWTDPREYTTPESTRDFGSRTVTQWAASLLSPYLLPPQSPPRFTLHRLGLTINRLYLAIAPAYIPVFIGLVRLATWEVYTASALYCAIYWILWYHNSLLAGLLARILYSLFRRRFLLYPTLAELRKHRLEIERADDFSKLVVARLVAARSVGIVEFFKTLRDLGDIYKRKAAEKIKNKSKVASGGGLTNESVPDVVVEHVEGEQPTIVVDEISSEEADVIQTVMTIANNIADLHERTKNIFLWRRPVVSLLYGLILTVSFFVALLPTQYLVKLTAFIFGIIFWHIIPVIAALPNGSSRFPPPLANAPTDAEYAMQLITERIAAGQDVIPKKPRPKRKHNESQVNLESISHSSVSFQQDPHSRSGPRLPDRMVDWQKWGGRVDATKTLFSTGQWKSLHNWSFIPSTRQQMTREFHTFPAHYRTPGLITLTESTLTFKPLSSSQPSLSITLKDVVGVRRSNGVTNGLRIRWSDSTPDGNPEEQEAKFQWVGGQEELFARLVGWNGRRWLAV